MTVSIDKYKARFHTLIEQGNELLKVSIETHTEIEFIKEWDLWFKKCLLIVGRYTAELKIHQLLDLMMERRGEVKTKNLEDIRKPTFFIINTLKAIYEEMQSLF